ncbi:MAG: YraN family protein [Gammaproteobacteria bacterium SHHR-1]|uniref:YraN family protein n=1 Tax=Magnetovirga frankeli TaxID=947516 RepID=UPI001293FB08|nr:YraN family protein [gamma proteobacterium SS-5]
MSRETGNRAEDQALGYLQAQGLRLLERNYSCRQGEIDLIMQQGQTLVFIEVRYRRSSRYGSPLESVDPRKQARLLHSARHYLLCHPHWQDRPCRFDVVGISGDQGTIQWLTNAFGE